MTFSLAARSKNGPFFLGCRLSVTFFPFVARIMVELYLMLYNVHVHSQTNLYRDINIHN